MFDYRYKTLFLISLIKSAVLITNLEWSVDKLAYGIESEEKSLTPVI